MKRLEGKVAIITGGARGMGAATVRLFVEHGARVVFTDVLVDEGKALASELGANARFMQHDVRDEQQWKQVVDAALQSFGGRVDALVNNAGVLHPQNIERFSKAEIERLIGINLIGPMLGIGAVVPHMKKQRSGSIINVSSVDGFRGCNGLSVYSASKWGLRGLSRSLAFELGHHGIRVNTMHPGGVNTAMGNPTGLGAGEINSLYGAVPLQRIGEPSEIAQASLFLASDEASYVSGAELAVDGGWSAGYFQPLLPGAPGTP